MTGSRAGFLAALGASVAAPSIAAAQSGTAAAPLRIASTASDAYAGALYAHDAGFFERAGLNADVQILASGAAITTAVAAKAVDIGISNALPLAAAVERGVPFRYFCSGGLVNLAEFEMCVKPASPITSWKDLVGKTVAVSSLNDVAVVAMRALVDQEGGDSSSVHLVEMPFSQMAAALSRGTVDAGPIAEPALTAAMKSGEVRALNPPIFSPFGPKFMIGGWFAGEDWLEANRALARRYADAIYAAAAWANTHIPESSAILAKYSKQDVATVEAMHRSPLGTSLSPDMLQPCLDLAYKYKAIDRPLKATDIIFKV